MAGTVLMFKLDEAAGCLGFNLDWKNVLDVDFFISGEATAEVGAEEDDDVDDDEHFKTGKTALPEPTPNLLSGGKDEAFGI